MAINLKTNIPLQGRIKYIDVLYLDKFGGGGKEWRLRLKGEWRGEKDDAIFLSHKHIGALIGLGICGQKEENNKGIFHRVNRDANFVEIEKVEGEKNKKFIHIYRLDEQGQRLPSTATSAAPPPQAPAPSPSQPDPSSTVGQPDLSDAGRKAGPGQWELMTDTFSACLSAVAEICGAEWTAEDRRAFAITLFIEARRNGIPLP